MRYSVWHFHRATKKFDGPSVCPTASLRDAAIVIDWQVGLATAQLENVINTLNGNRAWMRAREALLRGPLELPDDHADASPLAKATIPAQDHKLRPPRVGPVRSKRTRMVPRVLPHDQAQEPRPDRDVYVGTMQVSGTVRGPVRAVVVRQDDRHDLEQPARTCARDGRREHPRFVPRERTEEGERDVGRVGAEERVVAVGDHGT